jgi:hypothetical protein
MGLHGLLQGQLYLFYHHHIFTQLLHRTAFSSALFKNLPKSTSKLLVNFDKTLLLTFFFFFFSPLWRYSHNLDLGLPP